MSDKTKIDFNFHSYKKMSLKGFQANIKLR